MKVRTLFLLIVLAVVGVFAALNWSSFTAPTTLSVGFGVINAPLGLIMLGLAALLTVLFLLFLLFAQTSAYMDVRRHDKELQAMRELAERAEASRFTKLQEMLERDLQKMSDLNVLSRTELLSRLDKLEDALSGAIDRSGNSLAAYMGEIEDRLEKVTRKAPDSST